VKALFASLFSLLLVAAQAMTALAPANCASCGPQASCCGDSCDCGVSPADGPAPAREATTPVSPQSQQLLPPPSSVLFELASREQLLSPASSRSLQPAATQPLFRLNCIFLI
jgi:hypothetical protein